MPRKRQVLEKLKRAELIAGVKRFELQVADRRVRDLLVEALMSSRRVVLAELLGELKRDRLKELCRALDLDDGGREKAVIIDRLAREMPRRDRDVATDGITTPAPAQTSVGGLERSVPRTGPPAATRGKAIRDLKADSHGVAPVRSSAPKRSVYHAEPDPVRPHFERHKREARHVRSREVNIQDGFLFGCLKEGIPMAFVLVTGKEIEGRIKRFDPYVILVDTGRCEILVYKHTISTMTRVDSGR